MTQLERDAIQQALAELTSFLLDRVPVDENWEDAYPDIDLARSILAELLA